MTGSMNITDPGFYIAPSLDLPEDEVQLWRVDLDAIAGEECRWQKLLSPDEQARAARFHFARDRQRFTAARAMVRTILASYLKVDPAAVSFSYSQKEKPSLAPSHAGSNIMFNASHSDRIALMAFNRGREIGVDVERVRQDFDPAAIARRFFSAAEQQQLAALAADKKVEAFFRCWTRKEAYIKATGDGLSLPLDQFDVSLSDEEENALLETRPDSTERERWLLREVPAGPGYVAAVCVEGKHWKLRDWSQSADARSL